MMGIQWIFLRNIVKFFEVRESIFDEQYLEAELVSLLDTKSEGKILFYRFSKKWHGFIYSLHKEDREILLKTILEICS
jgi:hypothetical protein